MACSGRSYPSRRSPSASAGLADEAAGASCTRSRISESEGRTVNTNNRRASWQRIAATGALATASLLLVTGCGKSEAPTAATSAPAASTSTPAPAAAADPYDISKMDFKPGPATITSERHTGPFASGSALSMDANVKPVGTEAVKEIRLDTTHKVIEIAPGV